MTDTMGMTATTTPKRSARAGAHCKDCGRKHDRGNVTDKANRKRNLIARDGGACVWCTTPLTAETCEADRIIDGGRYSMANVVSACFDCNRGRGDTPWRTFLAKCKAPEHALAMIMAATGGREPDAHLGK